MANAKNTAEQYNTLRADLKTKTSVFAEDAKDKKQAIFDSLSGVTDEKTAKDF